MSRQQMQDFIIASERSPSLRRDLKKCSSFNALIKTAREYGFFISKSDIEDDIEAIPNRIRSWFELSSISPIKK